MKCLLLEQIQKHDLAKQFLEGTFPIFVDEIEKLLETHSQLLSIIKTSVQNKTARIVYTRSRRKDRSSSSLQPSYLRPILNLLETMLPINASYVYASQRKIPSQKMNNTGLRRKYFVDILN